MALFSALSPAQHVSLANTEILKTVGMTLSADNPENSDTHWAAVAISLNLSPKQQADSIILHDLYMRWTGRINAERHQCSCLLSAAMEASSKSHERAYSGSNQGYQPNDAELMEKMHKTVVQDRWGVGKGWWNFSCTQTAICLHLQAQQGSAV